MSKKITVLAQSILVAAMATSASAASILPTITATCSIGDTVLVGSQDCALRAGDMTAFAFGAGGLSGMGTSYIIGTMTFGAYISGFGLDPSWASARVNESLTTMLYVPGPVRTGLATVGGWVDGERGFIDGGAGYSGSWSVFGLWGCAGPTLCQTNQSLVPFVLGVPFRVTMTSSAGAACGLWCGGEGQLTFHLQAFEADGTPVNVEAVPEPTSLWLVFPTAIVAVFGKRRANANPAP